jgi:hypothetical protein
VQIEPDVGQLEVAVDQPARAAASPIVACWLIFVRTDTVGIDRPGLLVLRKDVDS